MPRTETQRELELHRKYLVELEAKTLPTPADQQALALGKVFEPFLYILADIADSLNALVVAK